MSDVADPNGAIQMLTDQPRVPPAPCRRRVGTSLEDFLDGDPVGREDLREVMWQALRLSSLDDFNDQAKELQAGALQLNSTFKSFIFERRKGCAGRTRTGGRAAADRFELGACHGFADELSSPLHHFPDL